jgi:lipoprotein-anchoring transpeptidase ErfK/SrfK
MVTPEQGTLKRVGRLMIVSWHIIVRRSVKLQRFLRFLSGAAIIIICSSCEEVPSYVQNLSAGVFPWQASRYGFWKGDSVHGSPKIVVYLGEQRAYFYKGKRLVGESTVSTGKPGFSTPPGHYHVISKDRNHVSSEFGDYVDDYGNVVKSNIDAAKDSQPPGTHFDGARMPYCMHFNGGYAMHEGYVPRYAASHGCIRLPNGMAEHFFDASREGTPVIVKE